MKSITKIKNRIAELENELKESELSDVSRLMKKSCKIQLEWVLK